MSDDELARLHRGGHDPQKVYNAYKRAIEHKGGPTVILAKTVKGYGLGSDRGAQRHAPGEEADRRRADVRSSSASRFRFRRRRPRKALFYRPPKDAPEITYLHERRAGAGRLSCRSARCPKLDFKAPPLDFFAEWTGGSKGRAVSTTMGFVSILRHLLKDPSDRQADRADHSGRRPHLRHGIGDPAGRHLRQPGPALQAARLRHAPVLPRSEGRPDSRRGHYRSRLDGVVHRGRHGVLRTTACR